MTATLALTGSNLCGDAAFSAAVLSEGEVTVSSVPAGERGDLASLCRDLCASRDLRPEQLSRIVLDVGPGSYTGLRVAVTFVRLLQQYSSVEVEGVCSLAVLARRAAEVAEAADAPVRTLLDARRGRWHTALHQHVDGKTLELEAARAAKVGEMLDVVNGQHVLAAPAAFADTLSREHGLDCLAVSGWSADALLRDGLPRFVAAPADLEPRSLMASYAED